MTLKKLEPEPGEPTHSSKLLAAYKHARVMRRLMLIAFFAIFAATLVYAIPWFNVGLTKADYNNRLTLLLLLLIGASISAFGAVYLREVSNRVEQTLMTWTNVHEGMGDLRRREYFYDRIVIECQHAQDAHNQFCVIALRIQEPGNAIPNPTRIAAALVSLEPLVKDTDCLAVLGPHEIGVLVPRMPGSIAADFTERLSALILAATDKDSVAVSGGYAVYPTDAEDAGSMVGIARERMLAKVTRPPAAGSSAAAA